MEEKKATITYLRKIQLLLSQSHKHAQKLVVDASILYNTTCSLGNKVIKRTLSASQGDSAEKFATQGPHGNFSVNNVRDVGSEWPID